MSSKKGSKKDSQNSNKNSIKNDKRASSLASDDKNGFQRSADYDELNSEYKAEAINQEKYETFRRIASAEEMEELDTFYNATSDEGFDVSQEGSYDLSHLDPEQREQLREEWSRELAKTEEEIQTLRQVLSAKVKQSHDLKRKLGITVWKEFREDMEQGIKNIQETTAYQKTTEAVKTATEKTTSAIGSFGGSISRKLGEVKNSNAFKSFEERVGTTLTSVKSKMSGSRSNSTNSFEDALNSTDRRPSQGATPVISPTIPEDKPVS